MLLVLSSLFRTRASVLQMAKIRKESSISSPMSQLLPRLYHLQLCGAMFCLSTLINNPEYILCFYYSISFLQFVMSCKFYLWNASWDIHFCPFPSEALPVDQCHLLCWLYWQSSPVCLLHHATIRLHLEGICYIKTWFSPCLCVSKDSSGWKWPTLSVIPRSRGTGHTLPYSVISMAPPAFVNLFKWPTESSEDILLH